MRLKLRKHYNRKKYSLSFYRLVSLELAVVVVWHFRIVFFLGPFLIFGCWYYVILLGNIKKNLLRLCFLSSQWQLIFLFRFPRLSNAISMKIKSLIPFLKKDKPRAAAGRPAVNGTAGTPTPTPNSGSSKSSSHSKSTTAKHAPKHPPKHKGQQFSNQGLNVNAPRPDNASIDHPTVPDRPWIHIGQPLPPPMPCLVYPTSAAAGPPTPPSRTSSSGGSSGNTGENLPTRNRFAVFSVMSYNVLSQQFTSKIKHCPPQVLKQHYREQLAVGEIRRLSPDVVCLQEVTGASYDETWLPALQASGYDGIFKQKSIAAKMSPPHGDLVDGCAIFYKHDQLELLDDAALEYDTMATVFNPSTANREENGDDADDDGYVNDTDQEFLTSPDTRKRVSTRENVGLIAIFRHLDTYERLILANTHLYWNPKYADVKTIQACLLAEAVEHLARRYQSSTSSSRNNHIATPIIICGDFNSPPGPGSSLYSVYSGAATLADLAKHEASDMHGRQYGRFTDPDVKWNCAKQLALRSAYEAPITGAQLIPFTTYSPDYRGITDYIWYSTPTLAVEDVLGPVHSEYLNGVPGFPSKHYPSDHISIMVRFKLRLSNSYY